MCVREAGSVRKAAIYCEEAPFTVSSSFAASITIGLIIGRPLFLSFFWMNINKEEEEEKCSAVMEGEGEDASCCDHDSPTVRMSNVRTALLTSLLRRSYKFGRTKLFRFFLLRLLYGSFARIIISHEAFVFLLLLTSLYSNSVGDNDQQEENHHGDGRSRRGRYVLTTRAFFRCVCPAVQGSDQYGTHIIFFFI